MACFLVNPGCDSASCSSCRRPSFLQLLRQVGGLALLHFGSPRSREGNDRIEAKLDLRLRRVDPSEAGRLIGEVSASGRGTDAPHARR